MKRLPWTARILKGVVELAWELTKNAVVGEGGLGEGEGVGVEKEVKREEGGENER